MLKNSILFAIGTFLSRVLGLVRDMVVASVFGAGALMDAFILAFRIPNLFREMFAEGALNKAFTRVYSEIKQSNEVQATEFFVRFLNIIIWLSFIISILGILLAPLFVDIMTLFSQGNFQSKDQAIKLTRLLFPFLGLMIVGSVFLGVLYQKRSFFVSSIAPMSFNMGYILGAFYLSYWLAKHNWQWVDYFGNPMIVGLSLGVLIGGFAQVSVYAIAMGSLTKKIGKGFFKIEFCPESKRVFKILIPAAIGASTASINSMVDTNFASGLEEGTLTWLSYGFRLLQLPIGLFAVGIGAVILPKLSELIKGKLNKNESVSKDASQTLQLGIEYVFWALIPCWFFILLLDQEIVQLLFQRGKFAWSDVVSTSSILRAYSVGLVAFGLSKILISFYFAIEQTSYTMRVSFFCVIVNLILDYILVQSYGYTGIAYSTGGVLTVYVLLLAIGLRKYNIQWQFKRLAVSFVVCLLSGIIFYFAANLIETFGYFLDSEKRDWVALTLELISVGLIMCAIFGIGAWAQFKVFNKKLSTF